MNEETDVVKEYWKCIIGLREMNCEVFLAHQGLGESSWMSLFLGEYKKRIGNKEIVMITCAPSRADLFGQCPAVDHVLEVAPSLLYALSSDLNLNKEYKIHNFLNMHYDIELQKKLGTRRYLEGAGFREQIVAYLDLPPDQEPCGFPLHYDKEKLKALFQGLGLKENRTVLVSPYANCYGNEAVPYIFWAELSLRLMDRGYSVVFNSKEKIVNIDGVKNVFLGLSEMVGFSALCGNIIGTRSGFFDVLAIFSPVNLNMQIIYPNYDNPRWPILFGIPGARIPDTEATPRDRIYWDGIPSNFAVNNAKRYVYSNEMATFIDTLILQL